MNYQATSPLTTTDLPASKENVFSSFGRGLHKLNDWFMKRAVLRDLRRLDSRMLSDLRISPSDFDAIASGTYRRDAAEAATEQAAPSVEQCLRIWPR